jgi:hypothetical protein
MRVFHWFPLNNFQLKGTFWEDLKEQGDRRIDAASFEERFKAQDIKIKKKEAKKETKSLLQPKRAQNLGIFERGYRMSVEVLDERLDIFPGMPVNLVAARPSALPPWPLAASRVPFGRCVELWVVYASRLVPHCQCEITNQNGDG